MMRDRLVPRKAYIEKIISILRSSSVPFQLEVEGQVQVMHTNYRSLPTRLIGVL